MFLFEFVVSVDFPLVKICLKQKRLKRKNECLSKLCRILVVDYRFIVNCDFLSPLFSIEPSKEEEPLRDVG